MYFKMKFLTAITSIFASAVAVAANTVTFKSLDNTPRTVYFTPSSGHSEISSIYVAGGDEVTQSFPTSWQGNFIAVKGKGAKVDGMLGEVTFNGYEDKTFFDVSAIVVPGDMHNIHMMYPASASSPTSGCVSFPCDNAYYVWDDVQTKVTDEYDLICTLGYNGVDHSKRGLDLDETYDHQALPREMLYAV